MAKDEEDDLLPDKDAAKGFYAKYEPKEILGRSVHTHTLLLAYLFPAFILRRNWLVICVVCIAMPVFKHEACDPDNCLW